MSYFKAKIQQMRFRLGLPQTPLGELTALPQTSQLDLRGPTSKERKEEGRTGWEGEGREWRKGKAGGEGRGREGERRG